MKGLKIGVLTFHRCINYGSYWQARCLAEGLQQLGHNAVILDHESRRINIAEWKCAYRPVLPTDVPETDYSLYRQKIEKFFSVFDTLPLSPRFKLDDPALMEQYDVVVAGSDEVWNLYHPWYGKHPLFYGDDLKAKRLISYAASFGNYNASWGLEAQWADKLRNFEAISVRDENSRQIVKQALGIEPELVLDPCLQFDIVPEERQSKYWNEPYLALYGHNFTDSFAYEVRRWANENKLPVISIGYRNDWADEQWIAADPHDFAHFISRTEALATNFFHGCVFALRNQKPFVCESSSYRSIKVNGLMAKLGGEKHLVDENTPATVYNSRLTEPLSPAISKAISRLRQSSNAYIKRALAIPQPELHEYIVEPT
jgi:hypothetical protein